MSKIKELRQEEAGFASLVIALILIIVLALLTVGFAQLGRREQQNALDKQLANEATYAAESGINDTYQYIKSGALFNPGYMSNQCLKESDLQDPNSQYLNFNNGSTSQVGNNSGTETGYTCVMVNTTPQSLVYDDVAPDASESVTFTNAPAADSLKISWVSLDSTSPPPATFTPGSEFKATSQWQYPALLQVSLTPVPANFDRPTLVTKIYTVYLYPTTGGGATSYVPGKQGDVQAAKCTPSASSKGATCSLTITALPGASSYVVHLMDYYDTSDITVSGLSGATPVTFSGAQDLIDVTGKAQNVLKRLQVRVPVQEEKDLPSYAIEAQNICKRESTNKDTTEFINPDGSVASSGDPCYIP